MNEITQQTIEMYAKLLKVPTFKQYDSIVRHLGANVGYGAIKAARFPYIKTFDELDLTRIENVEDSYLRELATCEFVKARSNIVLIGNPGTGKTHLSVALGINACNLGLKVRFFTAANLANSLIEAQDNKSLMKLERQIASADLLIIDELSYLTFNLHQSELLFKVISDRAERQSVIVSTNLSFSEWTTMFENTTMVTALVGRLTFKSHVLNMNSEHPYREEYAATASKNRGARK